MTLTYNGQVVHPSDLGAASFVCVPSWSNGFVQVDPNTPERFIFSDGRAFYPFGMDFAWQNYGQADYPQGFATFRDNHINFARVWMNNWDNKNLEWAPNTADSPPIGTYSQVAAQRWDMVLDNAQQDGIYVQMTLQHHGQYTIYVDGQWAQNPFNVANGGWLTTPDQFFTDPKAITLTENKYRYIVARYGWSTHLMGFELFNEIQNDPESNAHFQDVVNWHNTMAAYIRSVDPYHHIITSSYTPPGDPLTAANLDYNQIHTYPTDIVSTLQNLNFSASTRPIFAGEWGPGSGVNSPDFLHQGLWAGIMTPTAGAAQFWYWDYVELNNQYSQFKSVADFLCSTGLSNMGGGATLNAQGSGSGPKAPLSFAPPLGFQQNTSYNINIDSLGNITGLAGVSDYLQGLYHPDLESGPLTFTVSPTQAGAFNVYIGTVAASGATPYLSVDGGTPQQIVFPYTGADHDSGGAVLSVPLNPGTHTVTLGNTGNDWVVINEISITNYISPVGVIARGTDRTAAFWAYPRNGYGTQLPSDASVTITGLKPGNYLAYLWDCANDHALKPTIVKSTTTGLTLTLPSVSSDEAGYLQKINW